MGRVLDLLEIVIGEGEATLTQAATVAGLTPTTALRHLRALQARQYLDRDDRGVFSAGPTLLQLASAALGQGPHALLISAAKPVLAELAERTGESAYLAVRSGDTATYVATCESGRAIRHVGWVGNKVPLAGTAVGEVLLGAPGVVSRTGAIESDITAVSIAVSDGTEAVAALSVIGPDYRMGVVAQVDVATMLRDASAMLTRQLGLGDQFAARELQTTRSRQAD